MIIQEMVYTFKQKADKLDSKAAANLKLPQIIYMLNEGQLNFVKSRYGLNNGYRTGFEGNTKRITELQILVEPEESLDMKKVEDKTYTADLLKTSKKHLFLLRTNFLGTKGGCSKKRLSGLITQTDDLNIILESEDTNPSFEWREVPFRIAKNQIRAYTDGTFELEAAVIDYLRYPVKMDVLGYEHFDKSVSVNQDCELPEIIHDDIVNAGVSIFHDSMQNPQLAERLRQLALTAE